MGMSKTNMREAGKLADMGQWTNDELRLLYRANELALAYLEGRGRHFGLVISKLRQDDENYKSFIDQRKVDGEWL